jgi:pyruvate dehydrogenase phosphatase
VNETTDQERLRFSMIRRAWKPLVVATVVGVPGYLYYRHRKQQTFDLPVKTRGPDGKYEMTNHKFSLLSMDAVNARIAENAVSESKLRPGGILWKYTTASLASNDPIEDAHTSAIIKRDETDPSAPGDFLFFAVMDGHSGTHTSQLLSKILVNAVVLELTDLIVGKGVRPGLLESLKYAIWPRKPTLVASDADPDQVSLAIQSAFTKLDATLINAPLQILAANIDKGSKGSIPDLSQHPLALKTMLPAISGERRICRVLSRTSQIIVSCQVAVL